jgi:NADH dehydrogenase
MNLIVGATGMVGSEVCRLLAAADKPVRALVRDCSDPFKRDGLESLGVTFVRGDLRDRQSLEAACQGATAVICSASSMPFAYVPGENTPQKTDCDGCLSLIDVARECGVQHFIYTSFTPMAASFPLQDAKRAVEARLRGSGLRHTILQPTNFAEIWLSPMVGFNYPEARATIYGAGENAISWISCLDVARFAVACLENPAAINRTIPLGGPRGISPNEVVRIFERVRGGAFEVTHVPVDALRAQLAGAEDPMQRSLAGLMLGYANSAPVDMTATLRAFPMQLRTVEEYARRVMQGKQPMGSAQ